MRHLFIINPRSFSTRNGLNQVIMELENCFPGKRSEEYKTYISRYPRDAVAAIHRYMTKVPSDETVRVYAVGGDGILFDCLNGMVDFKNAELSAIPYGSSNDFVRAFGEDAAKSFRDVKKLSAAPARPVDIINCGSNHALNAVGFGVESEAVLNANAMFRHSQFKGIRKTPVLAYQLGAIKAIFNEEVRRQNYRIQMDEEDLSGCYSGISVSNTPCEGGSVISSPYAKADDGLMDVIFVRAGGAFSILNAIGDFTTGQFEKNKLCFRKQCRTMMVQSDVPIRVHLDGETFYAEEVKLQIVPGGVKFFAPEGMNFKDYSFRAYKKKEAVK